MRGSIRSKGKNSWQLQIYTGAERLNELLETVGIKEES